MRFFQLANRMLMEDVLRVHYAENPTINDLIIQFYEITHKRASILYSKRVRRGDVNSIRDSLVGKLEDKLSGVVDEFKNRVRPVFESWLESHAITEPAKWAKGRVRDSAGEIYKDSGEEPDIESVIESLVAEYNRYKYPDIYRKAGSSRSKLPKFGALIHNEIIPAMDRFPRFQAAFGEAFEATREEAIEQLEQYSSGDSEVDIGAIGVFDNRAEAEKAIRGYTISSFIETLDDTGSLDGSGGSLKFIDEGSFVSMIEEIYEKVVFPMWYGKWKAEGIDRTRAAVQKAYSDMILKKAPTVGEEISNVGAIIQTVHQNGNLLRDYYNNDAQYPDDEELDMKLLQSLTDGTYPAIAEWDADVREAGF